MMRGDPHEKNHLSWIYIFKRYQVRSAGLKRLKCLVSKHTNLILSNISIVIGCGLIPFLSGSLLWF